MSTAATLSSHIGNVSASSVAASGYRLVASDGGIFSYGDAAFYGSAGGSPLNKPIVGMASTPDGGGYWLVASDGGIFSYGDAAFYGSAGGSPLNKPIVGMASSPDGGGYWLVASDGGIFSYGDAAFYGSAGGSPLNKPIVGMASSPDGGGYWLVASDGGIFSYGDAAFYGSAGGSPLNKPIVGMASSPDGGGYWLVASDGGIFSYGDAAFYGSAGGSPLNKPIVGMASSPDGGGYWLVASDGGIFSYGDAAFYGSAGGSPLNKPIVGMASPPRNSFSPVNAPHKSASASLVSSPSVTSGGSLPLAGASSGLTSCSLTISPPVAGYPQAVPCPIDQSGSPQPMGTITFPLVTTVVPVPYTLTLAGNGPGGTATASTTVSVTPAWGHEQALLTLPAKTTLPVANSNQLSCAPGTAFCMVGLLVNGHTEVSVLGAGGTWTTPTPVPSLGNGSTIAIGCATPTFCIGTGRSGGFKGSVMYFEGGSTWSPISPVGQVISTISCPSKNFCEALATDTSVIPSVEDAITYTNTSDLNGGPFNPEAGTWQPAVPLYTNAYTVASQSNVACSSPTLCVATFADPQDVFPSPSGGASYRIYNGQSWGPLQSLVTWAIVPNYAGVNVTYGGQATVSCATNSVFCELITEDYASTGGQSFTYDGAMSGPTPTAVAGPLSCPVVGVCVAIGGVQANQAATLSSGRWGPLGYIDPTEIFPAISCSTVNLCSAASSAVIIGDSLSPISEVTTAPS